MLHNFWMMEFQSLNPRRWIGKYMLLAMSLAPCVRYTCGVRYILNILMEEKEMMNWLCLEETEALAFDLDILAQPGGFWNLSSLIGIEPGTSAMRVQSPNHWAAREFPDMHLQEVHELGKARDIPNRTVGNWRMQTHEDKVSTVEPSI